MNPIYTPEFFAHLEKMVDKRPHKCRDCGVADGTPRINKDGSKQKFPAVVRLCLIDRTQPTNDVNNIGMYCTRCRKPDQVWKTPRRMKPSKLPQLFGIPVWDDEVPRTTSGQYLGLDRSQAEEILTPLQKIQRNARNKVSSKPVVDDDGDPIPF